jgi:hypothetical protein
LPASPNSLGVLTAGEELTPECVIDKIPKKIGWIFWGSFPGFLKGPGIFVRNAKGRQELGVPN